MKNLLLKIACVVVAVLVWIQVAATTMVETDIGLPLEVVGLQGGTTVAGSTLPDLAQVRLRAPKLSFMAHDYLGVSMGTVQIDLANEKPGPPTVYVLKESDVRTDAEVVTLLPPVRLPMRLDWEDTRRLPVRVPLRGDVPEDRMLAGVVTANPESLDVTGPRRYFNGVDSLRTEVVDLATMDKTMARDIPLIPPPGPLQVGRESVLVTVPITVLDERVLANVPVIPLVESMLGEAGVSPPVCDVLVRGPADSVAALSPSRLTVTVPVAGLGPGVHQIEGQVEYPDWAVSVRLEPASFMVLVGERPTGESPR